MKASTLICFLLFLAGVALFLLQLWFQPWGAEIFFKMIVTDGVLFGVSLVAAFLIGEGKASKKLNGGNELD